MNCHSPNDGGGDVIYYKHDLWANRLHYDRCMTEFKRYGGAFPFLDYDEMSWGSWGLYFEDVMRQLKQHVYENKACRGKQLEKHAKKKEREKKACREILLRNMKEANDPCHKSFWYKKYLNYL